MSRRLEIAAAVAVAAVFAGGAGMAALDRGGRNTPTPPTLTATTSFSPSELLFGDAVHAEVDVVTSVPARLIHVETSFAPYRIESATQTTIRLSGSRTQTRHRFTLSCLRTPCAIAQGQPGRVFAFPAALVSARGLQVEADWDPLVVFPRTLAARSTQPRTDEAFATPAHHGSNWLAGVLAGVLLLGAALAPFLLRRRRTHDAAAPVAEVHHLREALSLARSVAAAVSVARIRGALEDLAAELEQGGRAAAAARVRVLAWAEQEPGAGEVAALTAAIERELT
jgi:hypothetical protein